MRRTALILFLVVCCQAVCAQDTIQPKWSYAVPTTIRHTSVRGERIGIALDSTVIVIDRTTGTELYRVATHRGVIEGVGLMPGDTTCVVVSASYDSTNKVVVNVVMEMDLRSGEEKRQLLLTPIPKQVWLPETVQTVCAFSEDGKYLYTSTPQFFNGLSRYLEYGNYQKIDLGTFTDIPLEKALGPHGSIELTKHDRIVSYWGRSGMLIDDPRDPRWSESIRGTVFITDQTTVSWKTFDTRIHIAPNGRLFYDARYLYDTTSLVPSTIPELEGTIDLGGLCHNGKHYYSVQPSITIRELGTNKVVRDLAYNTSDTTYLWWLEINDSLFTIAQERHITSWASALESEYPARIVHTLPDTITKNTCLPATVKGLPLGIPMQINASASNGSLRHGVVQFTQVGEQSVILDLVVDGVVRQTLTHDVVVTPLSLHPKASWGMKIPETIASALTNMPRFSADGLHVAFASRKWLALASLDDSAMHCVRFDSAHVLLGVLLSPAGDAYIVRDSIGTTYYNSRGQGSTRKALRTDVLRSDGATGLASMHHHEASYGYQEDLNAHSSWDSEFGWIITLRERNQGGISGYSHYDAITGAVIPNVVVPKHITWCFDRDPITDSMWWLGFMRYAINDPQYHYAYRTLPDGAIDSVWFPIADRMKFVVQGSYVVIDGNLYDRRWQRVGPDSSLPRFTTDFLGELPFALEVVVPSATQPTRLRLRRLPDGAYIDSVDFDARIAAIDASNDGKQIALTFTDGTLQVFETDTLFTLLPFIRQEKHSTDTIGLVAPPTDQTVKGLVVTPHPVLDVATISIERWNQLPLDYQITDLNGRVMKRGVVPATSSRIEWKREDAAGNRLSAGVYVLMVTDGASAQPTLIVVE